MRKRILMLLLVVVVCTIFMLGCSSKSSANKIYLNDYVVFEESGIDRYGTLDYHVNYEQIIKDYAKKFEKINAEHLEREDGDLFVFEIDEQTRLGGTGSTLQEALTDLLSDYAPKLNISETTKLHDLSNGDTCEFVWEHKEEELENLRKILGVKIVFEDFSHKIEKLQPLKEVDPFENVKLNVFGKSGSGTAQSANIYVCNQYFWLDIEAPNNGTLKNGDVVHVKLDKNFDAEKLAKEHGVVFSKTETDIEIHGLNAYGQANASNGKKATINLNNYVVYSDSDIETSGYLCISLDYERMIKDNKLSLSENVADENLFGFENSSSAAHYIFREMKPFEINCISHACENHGEETSVDKLQVGDVVKLSWKVNEEAIAALKKVMNVEFTYSDFTYTVKKTTEP